MRTREQVIRPKQLFVSILWLLLATGLSLTFFVQRGAVKAQPEDIAATTKAYVEQFYPLWFTYHQGALIPHNQLVGPDRISPLYHVVVAINDDTLYVSTAVDFAEGPVILTVPETVAGYSVLTLDSYGNVFESGVPSKPSGAAVPSQTYAFIPPDYTGPLPAGVTPTPLPYKLNWLLFRVDKFAPNGVDQTAEASTFRASLKLQPLNDFVANPGGGAARIVPEIGAIIPFKTIADTLLRFGSIEFLSALQTAVHASSTPPLTPPEQALSDAFDAAFGAGGAAVNPDTSSEFRYGARTAHDEILSNYLDRRGPNNWIHFTNIGKWGDAVLDRASITEFIQYGNDISAAAYYHVFVDDKGAALDGKDERGYVLTFPPDAQPPAQRFWSLTAYLPESIELIPNPANKYVVARYTPGLQANADGSVSIHISRTKPEGVPDANWLPTWGGKFNLMLRIYGVEPGSSVAENTYVPPPIVRRP